MSLTRRKIGFSLIELLVVTAITAILAGMLLPILNNARILAKQTQCLNNLLQCGFEMVSYINDCGYWPWPIVANDDTSSLVNYWSYRMMNVGYFNIKKRNSSNAYPEITKNDNVTLLCPETKNYTYTEGGLGCIPSYLLPSGNWDWGNFCTAVSGNISKSSGVKQERVKHPSEVIALAERRQSYTASEFEVRYGSDLPFYSTGNPGRMGFIHKGKACFLWTDGHTEALEKRIFNVNGGDSRAIPLWKKYFQVDRNN